MDRLMQSARGLVDVRPAHPTEGADPAAVVTRIRGALDAGDLKTALSEWRRASRCREDGDGGLGARRGGAARRRRSGGEAQGRGPVAA